MEETNCFEGDIPFQKKEKRGGKRKNSGRKFQNKTKHFLGLKYTPEEFEEIEKTFKNLKETLKMNNTDLLKHIIIHFKTD